MNTYLKYFENKTLAEGYKVLQDFVGYLGEEDKVLYSRGGEVIKDGEMVEDVPDPTEGFVDLGLSVMWASCNLGASSPEEPGLFYRFNNTQGYTSDQKEILNIPNPNSTDWLIEKDPIYLNSTIINKDLLCPRIPTATQFQELIDNTTIQEEVVNGKSVIRFTAENGNSIILPFTKCIVDEYDFDNWIYWTSTMTPDVNIDNDYGQAFIYTDAISSVDMKTIYGIPLRGICNLPPLCENILFKNKSVKLKKGENYFALLKEDISNCILTATTTMPIKICGLNDTVDSTLSTIYNERVFISNSTNSVLNLTLGDINRHTNTDLRLLPMPTANIQYQYVKIVCEEDCWLEMTPWDTSIYKEEFENTAELPIAQSLQVPANSGADKYRIKYADLQFTDLVIKWNGSSDLKVYILDNCKYGTSYSTEQRVVQYTKISKRSTKTIAAATIDSWSSRVDGDGYLYVEFSSTVSGYITFTPTEPTTSES